MYAFPPGGAEGEYQQQILEAVDATVRDYLADSRGEPVTDIGPDTPFMIAGLDSLDMLKVRKH